MSIINKLIARNNKEISEESRENINNTIFVDSSSASVGSRIISSVATVTFSSILKLNWLRPTVFDYLTKVDNNYDIDVAYGDIENGAICRLLKIIISKEKEILQHEECFFSEETRHFEMSNFKTNGESVKFLTDIVDFCANISIKNFSRVNSNTIKNFITKLLNVYKTNEVIKNNQTFVIFSEKTSQCGTLLLDVEYKQDFKGFWFCETLNVSVKIKKKYVVFHDTKDLLASLNCLIKYLSIFK